MPNHVQVWSWNQGAATDINSLDPTSITHHHFGEGSTTRWRSVAFSSGVEAAIIKQDLDDLSEFQSSAFHPYGLGDQISRDPATEVSKRKQRGLTIAEYIPEPHYVPVPEPGVTPRELLVQLKQHTVKHFIDNEIKVLLNSLTFKLDAKFLRWTWIIPLRGRPTYSGKAVLTRGYASMCNDSDESGGETTHGSSTAVTWTPLDASIFWLWLQAIQQNGIFGNVSLSVTSTKPVKPPNLRESSLITPLHTEDRKSLTSPHRRRERFFHFAIFHDAVFSLRFRKFVGAFNPKTAFALLTANDKSMIANKFWGQSVRDRVPLKQARLLLTDDEGKPLLVS